MIFSWRFHPVLYKQLWYLIGIIGTMVGLPMLSASVVFDNTPSVLALDYSAEPFEAGHIVEIGDRLTLAGTDRHLTKFTVILTSLAHSEDFGNAASFDWPLTLRIYRGGTFTYPGQLLATVTHTMTIPYRPIGWSSNGMAFAATFDLAAANFVVPDTLVYTVSVNTTHFGAVPTGIVGNQNYNHIAFAYDNSGGWCSSGTVGANEPSDIFDYRDSSKYYRDDSLPDHLLRRDVIPQLGGQSATPLIQVSADSYYWEASSVFVTGPSEFYFSGVAQGPTNATVFGTANPASFVYASVDGTTYPTNAIPPTNPGRYWAIANVAASAEFPGAVSAPFSFEIKLKASSPWYAAFTLPSTATGGMAQTSSPFPVQIFGASDYPYNGTGHGPTNVLAGDFSQKISFLYSSIDGITYPTNPASPTNVGVYSVIAVISGQSQMPSPVSSPFIFTISPLPLSIIASDQIKVLGTSLDLRGPQSGFVALGLTNSETIGWVGLSASGGTATNDPVGSYVLNPFSASGGSFNSNNYAIRYLPGQLNVIRPQSVVTILGPTAFDYSGRSQGPTTVSVSGSRSKPVLLYSSVDGVSYPPSNSPPVNVGNYVVVASVAADSIYPSADSAPFTFRINPILLTIQPLNIYKPYGTSLVLGPGQTGFFATGLVNSDTIGTITLSCPVGTSANAPVGDYALIPSAATGGASSGQNYLLNYRPATFTVLPIGSPTPSSTAVDVPLIAPWSLCSAIVLFVILGSQLVAARVRGRVG